ncbi:MAG: hypothetical protein E7390_01490 [Ruminococcaceae bacterium]|nr:hypothetical protein [Oscillospiraceae bacterium]
MKNKLFALLLAVICIFAPMGAFGAAEAEPADFLLNGGFEQVLEDGKPQAWSSGSEDLSVTEREQNSGSKSIHIKTDASSTIIAQTIKNMIEGETYTVSVSMKVVNQSGGGPAIKLEFRNHNVRGVERVQGKDFSKSFKVEKKGQWETHTVTFEAPANGAVFLLRFNGAGEVYYDDVSLKGKIASAGANAAMNYLEPLPGEKNKIANGSFETVDANGVPAEGWSFYSPTEGTNTKVSVDSREAYDGKNSVRLYAADNQKPWLRFYLKDITPGATYQLEAYLKQISVGTTGAVMKFEYSYDPNGASKTSLGENTFTIAPYFGGWQQIAMQFVAPDNCQCIRAYLRLYGPGEVLWDNASCYKVKEADAYLFETDNYFYYSEWDKGNMTLNFNPVVGTPEGHTADLFLKDKDGNVLKSAEGLPLGAEGVTMEFPVHAMTEKKTAYTAGYTVYDAAGNVADTGGEAIYRYDRPTRLREDGVYLKDGKPFFPVIGYHVQKNGEEDFKVCQEAGINVIQFFPENDSMEQVWKRLDLLQEYGLMACISLYAGMKPAGHEVNAEYSTKVIEATKDHPAVFAYMIMDEPGQNGCKLEDLKNSYKVIRDATDDHPAYMLESPGHISAFENDAKCVDVFVTDVYPSGYNPVETRVTQVIRKAKEAVRYQKPVYCITQVFRRGINPTPDNVRHMSYQALEAGCEGIGYYDVRDYTGYLEGGAKEHLWERDCYEGLKFFSKNEQQTAFEAFVLQKYPILDEKWEENYYYRTYVKDDKIYANILNLTTEKVEAEIPLESRDGKVKVGAFSAKELDITEEPKVNGTGTLSVTLDGGECAYYEITPSEKVDTSQLTVTQYRDLSDYPWAKAQIELLREKGIVNTPGLRTYAPGENVSRADFAMFLVRTLGMEVGETESFADVEETAYYAKELAAGKAAGILKGMGENVYAPYAEISRQDLMVICARGLRIAGKMDGEGTGDLGQFSDAESIADYAKDDVAAMVGAGVVKGNADGTVNPLGNATRAEAAVIMQRILEML